MQYVMSNVGGYMPDREKVTIVCTANITPY